MAKMTHEEMLKIIEKLYTGATLRRLFDNNTGRMQVFYEAVHENPELLRRYNQAQQAKAEILADEIIDISDHEIDPNRARVMVDSRKWYASKMTPHKYGDRIDLNLTQTVDLSAAIVDARKRTKLVDCSVADKELTQRIEIIEQKPLDATGYKPDDTVNTGHDDDIFS